MSPVVFAGQRPCLHRLSTAKGECWVRFHPGSARLRSPAVKLQIQSAKSRGRQVRNVWRVCAQTDQQQQQQQDVTRRVALPATLSVLIAAAGFVFVRNVFSDLAGPEGKKATLEALSGEEEAREGKVAHTDEEWHELLSPAAYRILRHAGTELPFSSPLEKEKRKGTFVCAGCGTPVYRSETKFDSGTGWPSFWKPVDKGIKTTRDGSIRFLPRTEVRCSQCEGHLGHVFNDGPPPTGLRYCMNGAAMDFQPDSV